MRIADRYKLGARLYAGTSVAVLRATERATGRRVVLKTLQSGSSARERLKAEHAILTTLPVPGIIQALHLIDEGAGFALVLEDLGGETLSARLAKGPLPLADGLRVAIELAETLAEIHQRRVVHKDINPSNILIAEDGRARIFDFDIATRLPREIQAIQTPARHRFRRVRRGARALRRRDSHPHRGGLVAARRAHVRCSC